MKAKAKVKKQITYGELYIYIYIYIYVCMYVYIYIEERIFWRSRLGLQNTQTAYLQKGKILPNEWPRYDTKRSDGEAPVNPFLPSLLCLLWPGVAAPDMFLSMG